MHLKPTTIYWPDVLKKDLHNIGHLCLFTPCYRWFAQRITWTAAIMEATNFFSHRKCLRLSMPGSMVHWVLNHQINRWLGQNSKAQKRRRMLREIQIHMRTKSSGNKYEVRQNYLPLLNKLIFSALLEENYDAAIEIMDSYFLDKELVDAITELEFPLRGQKTLSSQLTTKMKTTFTKT